MPFIKATFFFDNSKNAGWTENIHVNAIDLTDAQSKAQDLVKLRVALQGNQTRLTHVRVSDDTVFRDSQIFRVPVENQTNKDADLGSSDSSNVCVLVAMEAGALNRRSLYMRGIPDNVCVDGGQFLPGEAFGPNFKKWANKLIGDQWAIKSKDRLTPKHDITTVVQDPSTGIATVTTADNHGLVTNDGVTIKGCNQFPGINGNWKVINAPSLTTFRILTTQLLGSYFGNGTAAKYAFVLNAITKVNATRIGDRKAGRPSGSLRGRRSRRRAR